MGAKHEGIIKASPRFADLDFDGAVRAEFLAETTAQVLTRYGANLSQQEKDLIGMLSKEIQKSLPGDRALGDTLLYTLQASMMLLGLTMVDAKHAQ